MTFFIRIKIYEWIDAHDRFYFWAIAQEFREKKLDNNKAQQIPVSTTAGKPSIFNVRNVNDASLRMYGIQRKIPKIYKAH